MPRPNAVNQLSLSQGSFTWQAASTTLNKDLNIPLFIKDMTMPIRKPKPQEIHTTEQIDHRSSHEVSTHLLFMGAPDVLQTQISGWLITPWNGTQWVPTDHAGVSIAGLVGNVNYGELIGYLLEGRWNRYNARAMIRRDPDEFWSPYGHVYSSPVIYQFEYGLTVNPRKQTFTATVYLER